jgi:hypothetical protein
MLFTTGSKRICFPSIFIGKPKTSQWFIVMEKQVRQKEEIHISGSDVVGIHAKVERIQS